MALIEYDLMGEKHDKVKTAIDRLQAFCPKEGYYLCFSGGKDSCVIKALADMAGVKYDAHYNATTVDPPELVRFIIEKHPDVKIEKPKRSMRQMIVDHLSPPTRTMRYCCEELKEAKSVGRICVTGVRWAESMRRKNNQGVVTMLSARAIAIAEQEGASYKTTGNDNGIVMNMDNSETRRVVERCYRTNTTTVNPIIDWQDDDVWDFIHQNNLPYCSLYDEGFERLGCIGCPIARPWKREKEFERWPAYRRMYMIAFEEMLRKREEHGKANGMWATAEDVMDWWLGINRPKQIDGQMSMDDIDGLNEKTYIDGIEF